MIHQRYRQMYEYEKAHWWYVGRRSLFIELLQIVQLKFPSTILDAGCGTGFNLTLLSQFGNAYGVDISTEAIHYCHTRGLTRVKKTDGKKFPFKRAYFDLVTCLDVLEHVENDRELLVEIKRVLKQKGYLILFVPAFSLLWSELDVRSHHYRRYKQTELRNILELNGFSISQLGYFNYLLFIPILLVRFWQKTLFGKKSEWGFDPVVSNLFMNRLLTFIFHFDVLSALKISPPFGVSLYVLCTKS